jgi:hypothetical protein
MTDTEASAAIAILRDAYPRQPFPDGAVAFYTRKLHDIDGPELVRAIDRLTNRSAFLPSVAEIRREVAEERLALPNVTEAWEIAAKGPLREAPSAVRDAAEFVGGRWAILRDDNQVAIRAQFREQYTHLRERALLEEVGAVPARLPSAERLALTPAYPDVIVGPVMARAVAMLARPRDEPEPLTDEVMQDAIRLLERGPWDPAQPASDPMYRAAEFVMVQASEES